MSYIRFVPEPSASKTSIWSIRTIKGFVRLGFIKWFGRWRGYAFFPDPETVFEQICLREIAEFCDDRTREYKEFLKTKKELAKKEANPLPPSQHC